MCGCGGGLRGGEMREREVGASWKNKTGLEPSHLKVMGDMLTGWDALCSPTLPSLM